MTQTDNDKLTDERREIISGSLRAYRARIHETQKEAAETVGVFWSSGKLTGNQTASGDMKFITAYPYRGEPVSVKEFGELEDVLYGEERLDSTVMSVIRDADGVPVQSTVELHEGFSSEDDKVRLASPDELERLPKHAGE